MLSARALAEKSADMPRRISLLLASCRSASVLADLSFAEAGSPRSAAASRRASVSIRLERSQVCASSSTYPLTQREVPKCTCFPHLHTGRSKTSKHVLPNRIGRFNGVRKQFAECLNDTLRDPVPALFCSAKSSTWKEPRPCAVKTRFHPPNETIAIDTLTHVEMNGVASGM